MKNIFITYIIFLSLIAQSCKKSAPDPVELNFVAYSTSNYISFETPNKADSYGYNMNITESFTHKQLLGGSIKIAGAKYLMILRGTKLLKDYKMDGHYQTISLDNFNY